MRNLISSSLLVAAIVCAGCGKKEQSSGDAAQPPQASGAVVSNAAAAASRPATIFAPTPVLQPILTAWQAGHSSEAVDLFVQANWSARPILPSGMALGLTDAQFKAIPEADRPMRNDEMLAQLDLLKQLVTAVSNAGDAAASTGENARARQCYGALKQFGAALDDPKAQPLLQNVGQVSKRMGERGLAKVRT